MHRDVGVTRMNALDIESLFALFGLACERTIGGLLIGLAVWLMVND